MCTFVYYFIFLSIWIILLSLCGGSCFASLTSIRKVTNLLHDKWITEVPFVGCIWAKWFWVSVIHNYYNDKLKAYIIGALHRHNYIGSEPDPKQLLRPFSGILNGFYQELRRSIMLCIYTGPSSTLAFGYAVFSSETLRHITLKPSCVFIFVNLSSWADVATKPTPGLTISAHEAQQYPELRQLSTSRRVHSFTLSPNRNRDEAPLIYYEAHQGTKPFYLSWIL
jgi:hypothetical protein